MDIPLPRHIPPVHDDEPSFRPYEKEVSCVQNDRNKGEKGHFGESQENPDERVTTLASLALASGTGRDVASFGDSMRRARFSLSKVALRAITVIVASIVLCSWLLLSQGSEPSPQAYDDIRDNGDSPSSLPSKELQTQEKEKNEDGKKEEKLDKTNAAEPSQPEKIVVYVSGAVAQPGVYSLAAGSRVNDAIGAAGGQKDNADLSEINLALPLQDSDHVHIPGKGEEKREGENTSERDKAQSDDSQEKEGKRSGIGGKGANVSARKININTATASQLQEIPGVGPVMALAIIEWRNTHGKFSTVEDLRKVSGIGEKTLEKMRASITVK